MYIFFGSKMSNDTETQYYSPQVVEDKKPQIEEEFESIEDAFKFYNAYTSECGVQCKDK